MMKNTFFHIFFNIAGNYKRNPVNNINFIDITLYSNIFKSKCTQQFRMSLQITLHFICIYIHTFVCMMIEKYLCYTFDMHLSLPMYVTKIYLLILSGNISHEVFQFFDLICYRETNKYNEIYSKIAFITSWVERPSSNLWFKCQHIGSDTVIHRRGYLQINISNFDTSLQLLNQL